MKKLLLFVLCIAFAAFDMQAQINAPQPSPNAEFTQVVGLTKVSIEYSRPGVKGRSVFGGLVPYGDLWRTGANASTKITFSDDVTIEGNNVPKGTYALYTIPGKESWEVIIHKNTSHWGTGGKNYTKDEDLCRFKVTPRNTTPKVETFTINVANLTNTGADIQLMWENTLVSFNIVVDTDSKVMADIERKLAGPNANTYYQAARYYFEAEKDMEQAHKWVKKAIDLDGDKFWVVRLKALIEAEMGDYKAARKSAQQSLELAKEAGNMDYVRLNEKSIAEWKGKK